MGFVVLFPLKLNPTVITTTNQLVPQIWQELVMIRHLKQKGIAAPKATGPWVDQAKTYFIDATNSDWKSAGLLYYYSFLNLAKALLVSKRQFSYRALSENPIFHGLQADLQENLSLPDYKIKVFPPQYRLHNNVFAHLYKVITGDEWPFSSRIEISVGDIAGHSQAISLEWKKLFGIEHSLIMSRSLLRVMNKDVWFEIIVPASTSERLLTHVPNWGLEKIDNTKITDIDKSVWHSALRLPARYLMESDLLRLPQKTVNEKDDLSKIMQKVSKEALKYLENFSIPSLEDDSNSPYWFFVPNVDIGGKKIKWHPLLSDYLIAFA